MRLYTASFNLHNCKKMRPMKPPDTDAGRLNIRNSLIRRIWRPSHKNIQIREKEEMTRMVIEPDEPGGISVS